MTAPKKDKFTSNYGFVLACVGAAVGLGNIWMFPWRLGQYGGAAFLVPYLLFTYILATTGLMGEYGLGRWAQKGPIGAIDKVFRERGWSLASTWGPFRFSSVGAFSCSMPSYRDGFSVTFFQD